MTVPNQEILISPELSHACLEFKVAKSCIMSAIGAEPCYGKHVAAFVVAVATGDIIRNISCLSMEVLYEEFK